MYLSRHRAVTGPRWALDGHYLPEGFTLNRILEIPASDVRGALEDPTPTEAAEDPLLPPVEPTPPEGSPLTRSQKFRLGAPGGPPEPQPPTKPPEPPLLPPVEPTHEVW